MTYAIQVANGGYLGWKLLERTGENQRKVFESDGQIQRSRDYFSEKMPDVKKAEQLVSDYRLLQVTLRAFGLDDDINNRLFIRKVLEADPDDNRSLVNKLSDKRYLTLNKALGFSSTGESADQTSSEVNKIFDLYVSRSFEKNIGERYPEIELALNAKRELPNLANSSASENTKWYQILGSKPLRKVLEGALGFTSSFGRMPIDRQLTEVKSRMERLTGSSNVSQFTATENVDKVVKYYLLRSTYSTENNSPYAAALTILRASNLRSR